MVGGVAEVKRRVGPDVCITADAASQWIVPIRAAQTICIRGESSVIESMGEEEENDANACGRRGDP